MRASAWRRTVEAAERHNDPGRFTALVGYEYTMGVGGRHVHRNVIFRGSEAPELPFSSLDGDPEDLWNWLDGLREEGIEALAMPHNMNQSDGLAFPDRETWKGEEIDAEFAAKRIRNEPVAEIRALPRARSEPRPIGLAHGQFTVPDSFFEPLPDDVVESFEGGDPSGK